MYELRSTQRQLTPYDVRITKFTAQSVVCSCPYDNSTAWKSAGICFLIHIFPFSCRNAHLLSHCRIIAYDVYSHSRGFPVGKLETDIPTCEADLRLEQDRLTWSAFYTEDESRRAVKN